MNDIEQRLIVVRKRCLELFGKDPQPLYASILEDAGANVRGFETTIFCETRNELSVARFIYQQIKIITGRKMGIIVFECGFVKADYERAIDDLIKRARLIAFL